MSLSSFLLPGISKGKAKAIDAGLDDLFRSTASAPPVRPTASVATSATALSPSSDKKRKATGDAPNGKTKRSKLETAVSLASSKKSAKAAAKTSHVVVRSNIEEEEDGDEAEEDDEDKGTSDEDEEAEEVSSSSNDEGDPSNLVHESLQKGAQPKGQSRHGKSKFVPSEETSEQRDARTIFVGNVAVEVVRSRPAQKQFKRHILSFVPTAKIESVRYRSVAFKKPTAELPDDNRKTSHSHTHKAREHDRDRAATWRANGDKDEDEAAAAPQKQYLTPQEKKRLAFIKHEIHEHVDAVNAYVVFAHSPSAEALAKRPANVPPPAAAMDPYDSASVCAEKGDGSVFMGRTLRVDVVKKGVRPTEKDKVEVGEAGMAGDPKATLFVGNLEFTSKEEDLRAFFESVVTEERGKPGKKARAGSDNEEEGSDASDAKDEEDEDEDDEEKPRVWVKRVRVIRDKDTQLGKGFAYVHFVDRECVDEILALEQSRLKFAKRKLRVQRCKTLPGGPKLRAARAPRAPSSSTSGPRGKSSRPGTSPSRPSRAPRLVPARAPKGNPELGAKLAHLPKEERKKAKAADADRVARRLAKKRAKALAEKGVKSKGDRERVRKRAGERKEGVHGKNDKPKKRVRSGNALMKMNTKK